MVLPALALLAAQNPALLQSTAAAGGGLNLSKLGMTAPPAAALAAEKTPSDPLKWISGFAALITLGMAGVFVAGSSIIVSKRNEDLFYYENEYLERLRANKPGYISFLAGSIVALLLGLMMAMGSWFGSSKKIRMLNLMYFMLVLGGFITGAIMFTMEPSEEYLEKKRAVKEHLERHGEEEET